MSILFFVVFWNSLLDGLAGLWCGSELGRSYNSRAGAKYRKPTSAKTGVDLPVERSASLIWAFFILF